MASRRERLGKGGENEGKFDRTNSFSPLVPKKAYHVQRKSFSFVERGATRRMIGEDDHSSGDDEEEEKMDMLWEDYFDEEMKRSSKVQGAISSSNHHHNLAPRGKNNNKVECKCVRALKLSKATKMPSVVFFVNLLKKVFLIHDSKNPPSFKKHSY